MRDLNDQLVKFEWEDKLGFYLDSKNLNKNIKFIKDKNIEYIILNPVKGFTLNNCDFLIDIPNIKKLDIVNSKIDIKGILSLNNLEELYLNVSQQQKVDFSKLNLRKINFEYQNGYNGLECSTNLFEIIVRKSNDTFLNHDIFKKYTHLKHLEIVQSNLPDSLNFLSNNTTLKELELHHCKSLINLEALKKHKENLEVLKITFSKKVANIDIVSTLKQLRWLTLSNSIPIKGPELIQDLPHLEVLIVYGSSYFEDGDLRSLKGRFKHLNIENKKHYVLE
jgi:hypothetical protein